MNAKTQERGHCPCCGREQAVIDGHMSKHGYTVEQGWFQGVCPGNKYGPIEHGREVADQVVSTVRRDVERLRGLAMDFEQEIKHPELVRVGHNRTAPVIPWEEAAPHWQQAQLHSEIWSLRSRAEQGTIFADFMDTMINNFHGQPLKVVELTPPAEAIRAGEKRKNGSGLILTAKYQDRARVIYTFQREQGGKVLQSWLGTQAWRKLEKVS